MEKTIEIWKPIINFENSYEISNMGRVKSLARWSGTNYKQWIPEKIKKLGNNGIGYITTGLTKGKIIKTFYIHRLVAQHFIDNPENKKEVNHKFGDKTDNRASQLEWSTKPENEQHCYRTGLKHTGRKHFNSKPVLQYTLSGIFVKAFDNISAAAKFTGFIGSNISRAASGELKTCRGFKWSFE